MSGESPLVRICLVGALVGLVITVAGVLPADAQASGPALEVSEAQLRAALHCPDTFTDEAHEPLLLVHGTFTNDWEHWSWNWEKVLRAEMWDVCTVSLPDRSLGDMQTQAEYVVFAIREIVARSGDLVDVLGHSQGVLHPRWAIRFWPDVAASVDDLVMLAGPNHGTELAAFDSPLGCFESCWQMGPRSAYLGALNAGDETPGAVSYTSIYTATDQLVQPQVPVSTSALDGGMNLLVQDVCPARPAEHASLMIDHAVYALSLDALTRDGPTDLGRLDLLDVCSGAFMPGADPLSPAAGIMQRSMASGLPPLKSTPAEPALRPYAASGAGAEPAAPGLGTAAEDDGGSVLGVATGATGATGVTPATGGVLGAAPALALTLPALAGRALRSRRGA